MASWASIVKGKNGSCTGTTEVKVSRNITTSSHRQEVKQNKQVDKYGTYFLEIVDQYGRPSGLSTSRADFHVLVNGDKNEFVVIRTKYIENIVRILKEDHKLKVVRSINGTVGYVINKNMILKFQEFSVN